MAIYQGDFHQARIRFEEKLLIERANNNKRGIEVIHCNLGYCELHQGASGAATAHFIAGIKMALHFGDREGIAFYLEGLAEIAGLYKEEQEFRRSATILLGAADVLRKTLGAPLPPMDQNLYERTVSVIRTYLDASAFAAAWATGQVMMLEESVAFAIATLSSE